VLGRGSHRVVLGAVVASALALLAPSAMAFSSIVQSGIVGDWGVLDNAQVGQEGARCFYANDGHGNSIVTRVRVGPAEMTGAHTNLTWVGWRFKILRSTDNGVTYNTAFTSPVWKDRASSTVYADGFVPESWYPAAPKVEARIRVQVIMFWYKPGTKSTIEGKASGQDDSYVEKFPNSTPKSTLPYCLTIEA